MSTNPNPVRTPTTTPAEVRPAAAVDPKYIPTAEQLAFYYDVIASAVSPPYQKKLARLSATLRLTSDQKHYPPAGIVLKALLLMCKMTNQRGS